MKYLEYALYEKYKQYSVIWTKSTLAIPVKSSNFKKLLKRYLILWKSQVKVMLTH